ncbi:MAG TPA: hypothetical protein PLZ64_05840 [Chitinophagales bacterium]|nr:hypothetical protein [Chitinophagales bacterium]
MEFAQKFKEAVDSFTAETKTNVTELRYNVENTVKNAISEGQEEVETLKNHFKATSERIQAKLKGPFALEKVQSDVKEEAEILVADFKTTLNRNVERVKGLLTDASAKVEKQVEEVKEEVKKATKKAKANA